MKKYDYFIGNNINETVLKSFMITKICNQNPIQYCFTGEKDSNLFLILKYLVQYLYPYSIILDYLLQLIFQIIVIYQNISFNQVLESEIIYIFIANMLDFIKTYLPKIKLNIRSKINLENNNDNQKLKLVDKIKNGSLYKVVNSNLKILHLFGSDYDKGYAYGKLCKNDFTNMLTTLEKFYKNMKPTNIINNKYYQNYKSMKECLLLIYHQMKKYIKMNHVDMMKGIANGSGLDLDDIIAITVIPELYHQHCLLLSNHHDNPFFLRTLDFFFYQKTHLLRVYHNQAPNISYCELGIPGTTWCITGVSEKLLCLGETSSRFKNTYSELGNPFYLYFKDILINCNNLNEAITYFKKLETKNSIFIIISSLLENNSVLINTKLKKQYKMENFKN